MQLGKKLNPSHPTVFVSVFLIEDVIQQPETWEKIYTKGSPQVHLIINGKEEKPRGPGYKDGICVNYFYHSRTTSKFGGFWD